MWWWFVSLTFWIVCITKISKRTQISADFTFVQVKTMRIVWDSDKIRNVNIVWRLEIESSEKWSLCEMYVMHQSIHTKTGSWHYDNLFGYCDRVVAFHLKINEIAQMKSKYFYKPKAKYVGHEFPNCTRNDSVRRLHVYFIVAVIMIMTVTMQLNFVTYTETTVQTSVQFRLVIHNNVRVIFLEKSHICPKQSYNTKLLPDPNRFDHIVLNSPFSCVL